MKNFRVFLFLFVGIGFLFGLSCQSATSAAKPEKAELLQEELGTIKQHFKAEIIPDQNALSPKIKFEQTEYDFGNINVSSNSTCEFKFTNVGTGSLVIGKPQSTCGCTIPTLEKKIYAPGEFGVISVTYSAGTMEGNVNKKIYVPSNDINNPRVALTIKAEIVQKVTAEPEELKLLFNKENAGCPDITLKSTDGVTFSVKSVKSSFEGIKVNFDPNEKAANIDPNDPNEKTIVLKPQVDVSSLNENVYGKIDIGLTHPECKLISIRFSVLSKFKLEPLYLALLQAEPGEPVEKQLWILSNYNEDFEIASAESEKGIVTVLRQEKIGTRYKFDLLITPPADKKDMTFFTDKFIIKTKNNEKLEVVCSGWYKFKQDTPTPPTSK